MADKSKSLARLTSTHAVYIIFMGRSRGGRGYLPGKLLVAIAFLRKSGSEALEVCVCVCGGGGSSIPYPFNYFEKYPISLK